MFRGFVTFRGVSVILFMIENGSFLFVTFTCGIKHETVGTADTCELILEHLPVVDFLEESAEVIVIAVWINHCIDKPEFAPTDKSRIITIVIHTAVVLILWPREDEVIVAEFAVCRMKHQCQRVHPAFERLVIVAQGITFEHDSCPLVIITESDMACVFIERVRLYGEKRRVSDREAQIWVLVCQHLSSIQALPKHVSICPFCGERPDEVDVCQDYKGYDK